MQAVRSVLAVLVACAAIPAGAANVNVSISVGQPGFYGRLDLVDAPPPQVVYAKPMMIERVPDDRPPIYLRVPPGHARNWARHCGEYHACGERVYFVRDDWYQHQYVPHYAERHGPGREFHQEQREERHDQRMERRDDRRDFRQDRRDDRRDFREDRRDDRRDHRDHDH